jgi:hypothetical protein
MLRALLLPHIAAALLGGPAFTATRCTYDEVSELASPSEPVEGDVWVKVTENAAPSLDLTSAMAAATTDEPSIVVGAPAACGRLNPKGPVIDVLRSSIAKEQVDRCGASMDACIEKLLECWLENLGDDEFESLGASATLYTSDAFERFGFAEIEFPDLTALGRGEPIVTHRARLSAAILACDARGSAALAEALRSQPPPSGKEEAAAPKKDPWAGAFKL